MALDSHHIQTLQDGYGPVYHRVYSISLNASDQNIEASMKILRADLNGFSPQYLARFEKEMGSDKKLRPGDEFLIHIPGPWNGPVRIDDVTPNSFRLTTLEGHLEAGEIVFSVKKVAPNQFTFEIDSHARSRDALVDLVYDKIPIAKAAQTHMWTTFCRNFATYVVENELNVEMRGMTTISEVAVTTERYDEEKGQWEKL